MDVTSVGYREWAPPGVLGRAVACVWARVVPAASDPAASDPAASDLNGDAEPEPTLVLPDACSDLIWQEGRGVSVAGPDTVPWQAHLASGAVLIGVRFAPGAGGPALRVPLHELRDQRLSLDDVVPGLGATVQGDLPPAVALRRLLVAAAGLVDAGPPDDTVQAATRLLADPRTSVADACHHVGLSERQLRRRCHQSVGYGPKTLQRVLRFRRFLAGIDAEHPLGLAGIAAAAGYADQAHLTRECRDLAGMTPADLRATAGLVATTGPNR